MAIPVKLSDIADLLEMNMQETLFLVNKATGKIVSFRDYVLRDVEENDLDELLVDCPQWQEDEYMTAREFLDHPDHFVGLPDRFDVDEYRIMADFCLSVADGKTAKTLLNAIQGKGAFRRFKNAIHRFGIQQQWYDYRRAEYLQFAKEWCLHKGIAFTEE